MDIHYDFVIQGVPDDETAEQMTEALEKVLLEKFNTFITITPVED